MERYLTGLALEFSLDHVHLTVQCQIWWVDEVFLTNFTNVSFLVTSGVQCCEEWSCPSRFNFFTCVHLLSPIDWNRCQPGRFSFCFARRSPDYHSVGNCSLELCRMFRFCVLATLACVQRNRANLPAMFQNISSRWIVVVAVAVEGTLRLPSHWMFWG